jgi:hypothetical protein
MPRYAEGVHVGTYQGQRIAFNASTGKFICSKLDLRADSYEAVKELIDKMEIEKKAKFKPFEAYFADQYGHRNLVFGRVTTIADAHGRVEYSRLHPETGKTLHKRLTCYPSDVLEKTPANDALFAEWQILDEAKEQIEREMKDVVRKMKRHDFSEGKDAK